jgi:hypothetical protein
MPFTPVIENKVRWVTTKKLANNMKVVYLDDEIIGQAGRLGEHNWTVIPMGIPRTVCSRTIWRLNSLWACKAYLAELYMESKGEEGHF